jgi:hypothetical protein
MLHLAEIAGPVLAAQAFTAGSFQSLASFRNSERSLECSLTFLTDFVNKILKKGGRRNGVNPLFWHRKDGILKEKEGYLYTVGEYMGKLSSKGTALFF